MGKKKHTRKRETQKLRNKKRKLLKKQKIKDILFEEKKRKSESNTSTCIHVNENTRSPVTIYSSDSDNSLPPFVDSESDTEETPCTSTSVASTKPSSSTSRLQSLPGYEAAKKASFSKDNLEIGYLLWKEQGQQNHKRRSLLEKGANYCNY